MYTQITSTWQIPWLPTGQLTTYGRKSKCVCSEWYDITRCCVIWQRSHQAGSAGLGANTTAWLTKLGESSRQRIAPPMALTPLLRHRESVETRRGISRDTDVTVAAKQRKSDKNAARGWRNAADCNGLHGRKTSPPPVMARHTAHLHAWAHGHAAAERPIHHSATPVHTQHICAW